MVLCIFEKIRRNQSQSEAAPKEHPAVGKFEIPSGTTTTRRRGRQIDALGNPIKPLSLRDSK